MQERQFDENHCGNHGINAAERAQIWWPPLWLCERCCCASRAMLPWRCHSGEKHLLYNFKQTTAPCMTALHTYMAVFPGLYASTLKLEWFMVSYILLWSSLRWQAYSAENDGYQINENIRKSRLHRNCKRSGLVKDEIIWMRLVS